MSDEDPEIQARINRLLDQVFATIETNKAKLRNELLPLLGLMSVEFNRMEGDFKCLLILLLNEPSLPQARKVALEFKSFDKLLKKVKKLFPAKFSDPAIVKEFREIAKEANALRKERNLMIHSVWHPISDPEIPFVRIKEDEKEPEVDFDVPNDQETSGSHD